MELHVYTLCNKKLSFFSLSSWCLLFLCMIQKCCNKHEYIWNSKRPKDFISSGLTCLQLKNSFVKTVTLTLEVWHVFLCITLLLKSSLHTVPIKAFLLLHLMQIQGLELSINTLLSGRTTKGWDNVSSSMEMETNSRFFLCTDHPYQ